MKAFVYYDGKLILTVIGMKSESEIELLARAKKSIVVIISKD